MRYFYINNMIIISNVLKFKKFKDTYILYNLNSDINSNQVLNYTLFNIKCDNNIEQLSTGILLPNNNVSLSLIKDGFYKIIINDIHTIYFNNWINLRTKLITKIKTVLCCKCNNSINELENCQGKEGSNCIRNQSVYNLIQTYIGFLKPDSLNNPILYNTYIYNFIQRTIIEESCYIHQELCNQLLNTCITGNTINNTRLFKFYIAIYYLSAYLYELTTIDISDTEESILEQKIYINNVFDFNKIKNCITGLGLNINNLIENNMDNKNVYYYQLNNPSISNNEELVNITNSYIESKPYKELSIFKNGYIVNYQNIGRLVFIIKEVENSNFILNDSLGNDVTDEFDINYIETVKSIIFISKLPYSIGNVYFKIKPL